MIHVHAAADVSISSAADVPKTEIERKHRKKVTGLVELDQFKYTLNTYREPLVEVGDSL